MTAMGETINSTCTMSQSTQKEMNSVSSATGTSDNAQEPNMPTKANQGGNMWWKGQRAHQDNAQEHNMPTKGTAQGSLILSSEESLPHANPPPLYLSLKML
ncbi:unnamed protein product [Cuscuta epithymum]|uniref:Uncharacterized protein n=1 Tax=Cuscuta epithymum TaxID=186058 RepID=A0AAV0CJA2_9ASTE|nr:unnamed protein product [Cuscuta epithymum]